MPSRTGRRSKPDTPCIEASGGRTKHGYAQVRVDGVRQYAHRVAYEEVYGPIPEGLVIDHLCENTGCIRADHLEAVTNQENCRRAYDTETCVNGHPWNPENTYVRKEGRRICRACRRERMRASKTP